MRRGVLIKNERGASRCLVSAHHDQYARRRMRRCWRLYSSSSFSGVNRISASFSARCVITIDRGWARRLRIIVIVGWGKNGCNQIQRTARMWCAILPETQIRMELNLDGYGRGAFGFGRAVLDRHAGSNRARHGRWILTVKATGDTHSDDHPHGGGCRDCAQSGVCESGRR